MASIPPKVLNTLRAYVEKIGKEIPIKKAVLFGSYAKGTFHSDSDVDLAIFSDYFEGVSRVDGITFLLMKAMDYDIDLEPVAFSAQEYEERLGIVDEIIRTGVELQELQSLKSDLIP